MPDDTRWSLSERQGFLRLHALPAADFWWARNTLTQRAVGPRSVATTILERSGMRPGDVAGLALLNFPYAWIGVRRDSSAWAIEQFDQTTGRSERRPLRATRVWLRVYCDFLSEQARFSYSTDGTRFTSLGPEFTMVLQLTTFQGVRYSLFAYGSAGQPGGYADFDRMMVREAQPRGLTRRIPIGQSITLTPIGSRSGLAVRGSNLSVGGREVTRGSESRRFHVVDRGRGRVSLRGTTGFISVDTAGGTPRVVVRRGDPSDAETFQWIETLYGDLALLSLMTHRYLRVDSARGQVAADYPGPSPDRADGATFSWAIMKVSPPHRQRAAHR